VLTPEERREIEEGLAQYLDRRSGTIEALQVVQRHRGWVSDEGVKDVAEALGVSPEDVDGVATFYNLIFRQPVGRHVILLCDSVSCWVTGQDRIREELKAKLGIGMGETTEDGRFTLLPIACLGACDRAPAMMVDDELFGPLDAATVDEALARYR
jgi:NADH-quinone oxidoreductase subunit E